MEKKVAMVTGAGRGIGRGIAQRLAQDGFAVVIDDLNEADMQETKRLIEQAGGECIYFQGDVTSEEDMDRVFAGIQEQYGRLDVLVNNAGVAPMRPMDMATPAQMRRTFDINVVSMMICAQRAVPMMRRQGGGKIINAASQSSFRETAVSFEYTTTKWAVRGMTRAMAAYLAKDNINVNAYAPGYVPTPMQDEIAAAAAKARGTTPETIREAQKSGIPLGRYLSVEDIAGLVSYLASPAADNVTGQNIMINGGQVMN